MLPCQDSIVGGRNGSGGLMVIIWIRWDFEGCWMIHQFISQGRTGPLAQSLSFHRALPFGLTSLYLNRIETKGRKKIYLYATRTAFKRVLQ